MNKIDHEQKPLAYDNDKQAVASRPSVADQLRKNTDHHQYLAGKSEKALAILTKHPEFEEFLVLQELLLQIPIYL